MSQNILTKVKSEPSVMEKTFVLYNLHTDPSHFFTINMTKKKTWKLLKTSSKQCGRLHVVTNLVHLPRDATWRQLDKQGRELLFWK